MLKLFKDILNKNEFSSSEGRESEIMKRVLSGHNVNVKPSSSRYYTRGTSGQYQDGTVEMDQYSGGVRNAKPSEAIESVKYDPNTQICSIVFRNGSGKAYDFKLTQQEFATFMQSSSKGAYVNQVLKKNNRIANYSNNGSSN